MCFTHKLATIYKKEQIVCLQAHSANQKCGNVATDISKNIKHKIHTMFMQKALLRRQPQN